ncbi:MAG: ABC transporter six-transmembrane domain-containing protein [Bacteroidota bacterium]
MKIMVILTENWVKLCFTLFLLLIEAGIAMLFPLFIGYAIDHVINGSYVGVIQLGFLGFASLIVGVGRRVFDSRLYAQMYQTMGVRAISNMKDAQPSIKSARLGMIREWVEFMENSLPELIHAVLGLFGVILIIATLNLRVFYASLIVSLVIFLVYGLTRKKTMRLNKSSNDEWEKQVDILNRNDKHALSLHLKEMMKWNVRLSDLEAGNFSISWIILISFLLVSIHIGVGNGMVKYGALFSLIMYIFQYMENVANLPLFYQNWLRLKEIKGRIESL